ncbi:hypothetical protein ACH0AH_08145 [Microbacterium paludicola]|uniref:hypothetical protein n=1 Tax=Microbacterium paludicola TaxID=300019 RepID=UPI0038794FC1
MDEVGEQGLMKSMSSREHAELLASEIYGVAAVKAFLVVRKRNAWHSTTSNQYRSESALFASLSAAESAAEMWRGRGSRFVIEEQPAIAVLSPYGAVITADVNAPKPFGGWNAEGGLDLLAPGGKVSVAVGALGRGGLWKRPAHADSIVQAADDLQGSIDSEFLSSATVYLEHTSNVGGTGRQRSRHDLAWTEGKRDVDPSPVLEIVDRVREKFGVSSVEGAMERYASERDAYSGAASAHREADYSREEATDQRERAIKARNDVTAAVASGGHADEVQNLEWFAEYEEEQAAEAEAVAVEAEAEAAKAIAVLDEVRPDLAMRLTAGSPDDEPSSGSYHDEVVPEGYVSVIVEGTRHVIEEHGTIVIDGRMYSSDGRRFDLNPGGISDPGIPDDREIVGAFVIMRDEEGRYSVYLSGASSRIEDDIRQPEPEVALELSAHIAQAWELANL